MPEKNVSSRNSVETKVIKAAFLLARQIGWEHVTLKDISEEAGISLSEMREHFEDKIDILVQYNKQLDKKVLGNIGGEGEPVKDRLFEILMDRFDLLNEDREALKVILKSFKYDPKQVLFSWPHLCRSMSWIMEAVGEDTRGIKGAIKVAGLSGVYLKTLKTWVEDDSADMAATMATLDKTLKTADDWVNRIPI
ncbi:MAG: TetR family transcriptional regulator [Alphaproteobacteria bacterium]|nr:TetR family transcriptional regulator [Alphaproteobacteria bacterium]|tara:strand:- start:327 stop:908 length:582 start_codon:yes stop_codon:yes gene_type:complete